MSRLSLALACCVLCAAFAVSFADPDLPANTDSRHSSTDFFDEDCDERAFQKCRLCLVFGVGCTELQPTPGIPNPFSPTFFHFGYLTTTYQESHDRIDNLNAQVSVPISHTPVYDQIIVNMTYCGCIVTNNLTLYLNLNQTTNTPIPFMEVSQINGEYKRGRRVRNNFYLDYAHAHPEIIDNGQQFYQAMFAYNATDFINAAKPLIGTDIFATFEHPNTFPRTNFARFGRSGLLEITRYVG